MRQKHDRCFSLPRFEDAFAITFSKGQIPQIQTSVVKVAVLYCYIKSILYKASFTMTTAFTITTFDTNLINYIRSLGSWKSMYGPLYLGPLGLLLIWLKGDPGCKSSHITLLSKRQVQLEWRSCKSLMFKGLSGIINKDASLLPITRTLVHQMKCQSEAV